MSALPDAAAFQAKLAALPVTKYAAGENVLTAGRATGKLLMLRKGSVEVLKDGEQIAKVSVAGAVFGELAALLDQPHTADVRALEDSEFHVADARTVLTTDPTVTLYVAATLARRLDSANKALIEVRHQVQSGEPRKAIGRTLEKVQELLRSGADSSLVYSGYPFDPFAAKA